LGRLSGWGGPAATPADTNHSNTKTLNWESCSISFLKRQAKAEENKELLKTARTPSNRWPIPQQTVPIVATKARSHKASLNIIKSLCLCVLLAKMEKISHELTRTGTSHLGVDVPARR